MCPRRRPIGRYRVNCRIVIRPDDCVARMNRHSHRVVRELADGDATDLWMRRGGGTSTAASEHDKAYQDPETERAFHWTWHRGE